MTIETPDTASPLQTYRTDYTEEDGGFWSGVDAVWDQVNLSYGEEIAEKSRAEVFRGYGNFKEFQKEYEAYSDTTAWYLHGTTEDRRRAEVEQLVEDGRFTLNTNNEVVDSQDSWNTGWVYDMDVVKGALLAKQNGWNATKEKTAYRELAKTQGKNIQERMESLDIGLGQSALGAVLGYGAQAETLFEVAASPVRIMGETLVKGAIKAFAIEGGIGALGEMSREYRMRQHKEMMGEEYGLWESAKNVMLAAGFAGGIRAGGSAFVDWRTIKAIKGRGVGAIAKELEKKGIPVEDAKIQEEIVTRFMRREQYILTENTTKHVDIMHKAERDIDNGKPVDVTAHTEISVEDKVKAIDPESNIDDVVENSLEAEVKSAPEMQKTDIETKAVDKTVDEVQPYKPLSKEDPFEGSATKAEGETVIEEAGNKAEYDEIQARIDELERPISERQQQIQEAAVPKIGGSEDEAKEAVKQHFRKPLGDKYKGLSKADIAEQDRMYKADLDMEANTVFAKFGDNLAAGTIAGIDEDEQGNITFNPEMFVAGLGGYTAIKALVKNKALRKTVGDSLRRRFNELDDNPMFNMIVGKQGMIDGRYKSDGLTKLAQKQADEMGFTPEDLADFDAEDFQYMNKGARMIDNMDKDIRKDPLILTKAELKAIEDAPPRPIEEIIADLDEWEASQIEEAKPTYKKGDAVTAERDPSIVPYKRPEGMIEANKALIEAKKKIQPEIDKTTRDANFKKWFGDSHKFTKDDKGNPRVLYHGSPHNIKSFKVGDDEMIYVTDSPKYAERYSVGDNKVGSIYPIYVSAKNVFDTRNNAHRKIFMDKFYYKWGNGTPLSDKTGLPDWVEAVDFKEFFESEGYHFDGVMFDEMPDNVGSGTSLAVFKPNQIKSVNNKGAFSEDGNILKGALTIPAIGIAASQQENN